mmetsp:Transcript_13389/g.32806  ORF Transcript_13389/g.32806 Transcript_13389/m.32806 type:complete len:369 (-) Transcript_13389:2-1108(-)
MQLCHLLLQLPLPNPASGLARPTCFSPGLETAAPASRRLKPLSRCGCIAVRVSAAGASAPSFPSLRFRSCADSAAAAAAHRQDSRCGECCSRTSRAGADCAKKAGRPSADRDRFSSCPASWTNSHSSMCPDHERSSLYGPGPRRHLVHLLVPLRTPSLFSRGTRTPGCSCSAPEDRWFPSPRHSKQRAFASGSGSYAAPRLPAFVSSPRTPVAHAALARPSFPGQHEWLRRGHLRTRRTMLSRGCGSSRTCSCLTCCYGATWSGSATATERWRQRHFPPPSSTSPRLGAAPAHTSTCAEARTLWCENEQVLQIDDDNYNFLRFQYCSALLAAAPPAAHFFFAENPPIYMEMYLYSLLLNSSSFIFDDK